MQEVKNFPGGKTPGPPAAASNAAGEGGGKGGEGEGEGRGKGRGELTVITFPYFRPCTIVPI